MHSLTFIMVSMLVFSIGTARAGDDPEPAKTSYFAIMETGGAPFVAKMPMGASDAETTLQQAQMAVTGSLAMLDKGNAPGKVNHLTFVETYAGLTSETTPRALFHSDPETFLEKFSPYEGLCAPLSVPFQTVKRRMEKDDADSFVLVIVSPLIDLRMEYCGGETADPDTLFREGPRPEYGFAEILSNQRLSGVIIVGASIDKEHSWNAFIQENAHKDLKLEWMTLGEAVRRFDSKLRSF